MTDEKRLYFTHTYGNGQTSTSSGTAAWADRMKAQYPAGRISERPPAKRAAPRPTTEIAAPPAPAAEPDAPTLASLAATTVADGKLADLYLRGKRGDQAAAQSFDKLCADMNPLPPADTRDPVAFTEAHLARKRTAKRADITAEIH